MDVAIIMFAVQESITSSTLVEKLPVQSLISFADVMLTFERFVHFSTSNVFRKISERFSLEQSGGGRLSVKAAMEYVPEVMAKFIERSFALFIKAFDLVIDGFIDVLLQEINLEVVGGKEGEGEIEDDDNKENFNQMHGSGNMRGKHADLDKSADFYLNQSGENRFLKTAWEKLFFLNIDMKRIYRQHMAFHRAKNSNKKLVYAQELLELSESCGKESLESQTGLHNGDGIGVGADSDLALSSLSIDGDGNCDIASLSFLRLKYLIQFTENNRCVVGVKEADFDPVFRTLPKSKVASLLGRYKEVSVDDYVFSESQRDILVKWFKPDEKLGEYGGNSYGQQAIGYGNGGRKKFLELEF